jgi:hypothetical protein
MTDEDPIEQYSDDDYEEYLDSVSNDDIYQILATQQQQLQNMGTVLKFLVETMNQKNSPPPDYRSLLATMAEKLVASHQYQQKVQATLERQSQDLQSIDRLTDNVQRVSQGLKQQSSSLQEYSTWKNIGQTSLAGIFAGMILLAGTHVLITLNNQQIEQKLNQLGNQNEKIWKKVQ